jgi:uncharacterized protein YccT (UPF0319 family)
MAKEKKSFLLYADQNSVFQHLPDDIAGRLIKHIFAYVNDEQPDTEELIIKIAFEPIKMQLKRDLQKYEGIRERNSQNAKMRWDAVASSGMPKSTKNADNDTDNVTDTVTVNDKEKNKLFKAPTVGELKSEFPNIDAESFHDFYTSKGWKIGKDPMKDWRAAARNWERRNNPTQNKPFTLKNKATLHDD